MMNEDVVQRADLENTYAVIAYYGSNSSVSWYSSEAHAMSRALALANSSDALHVYVVEGILGLSNVENMRSLVERVIKKD